MKMKKLAIVLTICATGMLGGCGHMLVPGWGEMSAGERNQYRQMVKRSIEKGFDRGFSRRMARRSPVRYGSFKSKATLSDGTVIRSKTKYRTGGWRKTKVTTKYY